MVQKWPEKSSISMKQYRYFWSFDCACFYSVGPRKLRLTLPSIFCLEAGKCVLGPYDCAPKLPFLAAQETNFCLPTWDESLFCHYDYSSKCIPPHFFLTFGEEFLHEISPIFSLCHGLWTFLIKKNGVCVLNNEFFSSIKMQFGIFT